MAYYDNLVAQWATLTGTVDEKLAAINAQTVAGPNVDVAVSTVVGVLMLSGSYLSIAAFANTAPNADPVHDGALISAKTLMALLTIPNVPPFAMSDPTTYARIKGMADALLAQELASSNSTGFTQAVHDALLALPATVLPWWKVNGYTSPFSQSDLDAAGGLT